MGQDLVDRLALKDCGHDLEFSTAVSAMLHVDGEDAGQECGPGDAVRFLMIVGNGAVSLGPAVRLWLCLLGHDQGTDLGVRCEAAEVAREVNARGWDEGGKLLDEFEAREQEMARAV